MILGKFLPDKATKAMTHVQKLLTTFPTLFSVGSETGGETKVSPMVWIEMKEFLVMAAQTVTDAKAAQAAIADGPDAFAVAWQAVAEDCTKCHAKFTEGMIIR